MKICDESIDHSKRIAGTYKQSGNSLVGLHFTSLSRDPLQGSCTCRTDRHDAPADFFCLEDLCRSSRWKHVTFSFHTVVLDLLAADGLERTRPDVEREQNVPYSYTFQIR